uniref:Uncharacterized protein n=1 Tax=viral metagenome TaxID=1070528 RepID=A0A6M3J6X7_9ZZZZ
MEVYLELNNHEIWASYTKLLKLSSLDLPFKTSLHIATILFELERPYRAIENERAKLCKKHGEFFEAQDMYAIDMNNVEKFGAYSSELSELLIMTWSGDFTFEPVEITKDIVEQYMGDFATLLDKFVKIC